MIDTDTTVKSATQNSTSLKDPTPKLIASAIFGLVFGFLLQKGGVGKYNVLIGQLLLQDWTVAKVMLSAIVVGMIGVFPLHHFAKVNLHIKPTRIGANIIGGLVFGAGFALVGYCPGTAAAALGQGSWDALFGMAGLIVGSWILPNFLDGPNERLRSGAPSARCCSPICCQCSAACLWLALHWYSPQCLWFYSNSQPDDAKKVLSANKFIWRVL